MQISVVCEPSLEMGISTPQPRTPYAEPFQKYRMENDIEIPLGSGSFLSMQLRKGIINAPMWFWCGTPSSSYPGLPPNKPGRELGRHISAVFSTSRSTYLIFQCSIGKVNSLFCIMFQSFRFLVFLT